MAEAPIRDPFALEQLYDAVVARMAADGIDVDQPFGRREHTKQIGDKSRITWAYGDPNGDMGRILPPRNPGGELQRPLARVDELFTCRITGLPHGYKPDDPGYERAQYVATRQLFDDWYRAVYLYGYGMLGEIRARWAKPERVSALHAPCLEVVGAIQAAIPDEEILETTAPVHARIEVSLGDVTEVETAPEV